MSISAKAMIMRKLLSILLLTGLASATCTTGTSGKCEVGSGKTYATIGACTSAMAAGQTCLVFVGTYNETVSIPTGTVGNYNTVQANASDIVTIFGASMNSHTKLLGNCPFPASIGTCGFSITNTASPGSACVSSASNTTDSFVQNVVMYACGGISYGSNSANQSHNYFTNITLSYTDSTSSSPNVGRAGTINGDYNLLDHVDISHVSDGMYMFGAHNILRDVRVHDVPPGDCGGNGGNCHIDFMQADAVTPATQPAQYLLIEGGSTYNLTQDANTHALGILQGQSCGGNCFNAIIRYHLSYTVGGGGIVNDNSFVNPPPAAWDNVKSYNNTWANVGYLNSGSGNGTNGYSHGSNGFADINSIFYFPFALADYNPMFCNGGGTANCSTGTWGHSLAFCTTTPCVLRSHVYGSGTWTSDVGNITADPQFVNYSGQNFTLQATSPARNSGTALTTVASGDSGTGTSLVVTDAGYFQDNPGSIVGVQPDCVSVTTTANHSCIAVAGINFSTNTITLVSSLSRSVGDPVYLYSISDGTVVQTDTGVDMGAFPFGSAPPPPTVAPATGLFVKSITQNQTESQSQHGGTE